VAGEQATILGRFRELGGSIVCAGLAAWLGLLTETSSRSFWVAGSLSPLSCLTPRNGKGESGREVSLAVASSSVPMLLLTEQPMKKPVSEPPLRAVGGAIFGVCGELWFGEENKH
jgi:hypothetical protein